MKARRMRFSSRCSRACSYPPELFPLVSGTVSIRRGLRKYRWHHKAIGKPMTEIIAPPMHIKHRNKGRADNKVENPLEGYGNRHSSTTNGIWEKLGDKHPSNRSPREHEAGAINHNTEHRDGSQEGFPKVKATPSAPIAMPMEPEMSKGLRPNFSTVKTATQVNRDIHNTHEYSLNHRITHAHILEDTRSIIEHGIDTYSLLEYRKHHTYEDTHKAIGEEFLRLHSYRILDIVDNLVAFSEPLILASMP